MFQVNTTIKELNLKWNNIGADGARAIADALKVSFDSGYATLVMGILT